MREQTTFSGVNGDFAIHEEQPRPHVLVLALHGDADLHIAPELRDRLTFAIDGEIRTVVIDLTETTFVDSMVLGVLLGAMKRLRSRRGLLRLVVPRAEIRRIFEITLLDRIFPLDATRDEALAAAGVQSGEA